MGTENSLILPLVPVLLKYTVPTLTCIIRHLYACLAIKQRQSSKEMIWCLKHLLKYNFVLFTGVSVRAGLEERYLNFY